MKKNARLAALFMGLSLALAAAPAMAEPTSGPADKMAAAKAEINTMRAKIADLDGEIFIKESVLRAWEHAGNAVKAEETAREVVSLRNDRRILRDKLHELWPRPDHRPSNMDRRPPRPPRDGKVGHGPEGGER